MVVSRNSILFSGEQTSNRTGLDWPMFCHDLRHTGRSLYNTNNNPNEVKWRFKAGKHASCGSPVIGSDGVIYFPAGGVLFSVNQDGELIWKCEVHAGMPIDTAPAIADDGTIYVTSYASGLHAISKDGVKKWHHSHGGSVASPAIDNCGTIYYGTFDKSIYAVNPDGSTKWSYQAGDAVTSSPAISDDGIIYIGSFDGFLYAFKQDGGLNWKFQTGGVVRGAPSIGDDGTIYVGSYDDYLYAVNPNGTKKWQIKVGEGTETNPSIANDGTIYVGNDKIYAINPDGTIKWGYNMGGGRNVHHSSPAISADGIIYICCNINGGRGGEILAVNPDGSEKWRRKIDSQYGDLNPAIDNDGTIYMPGSLARERGDYGYITISYLFAIDEGDFQVYIERAGWSDVDEPIKFHGDAYNGEEPYSWYWDFGDGGTSTEQNPIHTYTKGGSCHVSLKVTDNANNVAWAYTDFSINTAPNRPSKPEGPRTAKPGQELTYTTVATDPDGDELYYHWYWGDGYTKIGPLESGETCKASHIYTEEGTYTLEVGVMDEHDLGGGLSDPLLITISKNKEFLKPGLSNYFNFLFEKLIYSFFLVHVRYTSIVCPMSQSK